MKILNIFRSRTVWVIIVLFLINGISGIRDFIHPTLLPLIDGLLGIAAIYFRVNPRVKFGKKTNE